MREKAEAKEKSGIEERKSTIIPEPKPVVEEDSKAWNLTQQLKSRMDALHGKGGRSKGKVAKRKHNYKGANGLSDEDTTPSEFDPNDSQYDDSSDESE